jgi:hypothetical protein
LQALSQQAAGTVELGFRGANCNSRHLGNLLVLKTFDVVQDEDAARPIGQSGHRLFEIHGLARFADRGRGIEQVEILGRLVPAPAAFAPKPPHDLVDGDPVQPGGECALATVTAELMPRPHEDILGQLLGETLVTGQPETERVHPPDVGVVQRPKGDRIPGLRGANGVSHGNQMPQGPARFEKGTKHTREWGSRWASSSGIHPPFRRPRVNYP